MRFCCKVHLAHESMQISKIQIRNAFKPLTGRDIQSAYSGPFGFERQPSHLDLSLKAAQGDAFWACWGCFGQTLCVQIWQRHCVPMCRHHTQSAEQRSLTLKLFMAQFVNTALSSLVANMYIPALYKRLHNTFLGTLIFQVSFCLFSFQSACAAEHGALRQTVQPQCVGSTWHCLLAAFPSPHYNIKTACTPLFLHCFHCLMAFPDAIGLICAVMQISADTSWQCELLVK